MVPKRLACDVALAISDWLRISFMIFLTLAGGFKTVGDLKIYFISRFKGVMFLTLKNCGKTNSPVPPWALERIRIAFNIEEPQELQSRSQGLPVRSAK
jgi:hypothetical protein